VGYEVVDGLWTLVLRLRRLSAEFSRVKTKIMGVHGIHTLVSAHCTLNFLLSNTIPSFDIVPNALCASSLIAKETYPTPFDTPVPCSRTTKADLTGAMSENNVCKSVEVAVYGRLDTKSVDLFIFQQIKSQKTRGI
jgi:hypothetical protein